MALRLDNTQALSDGLNVAKPFKFRLYPTKQQRRLELHRDECRWLYNRLLADGCVARGAGCDVGAIAAPS